LGRRDISLSNDALTRLCEARWRGNIRELRNTLERAAILSGDRTIAASHIRIDSITDMPAVSNALPEVSLADLEELAIRQALDAVGGNRKLAAERLGIGLRTLYEKLKRYEL
jgi:two-component system response regulator FlrC